MKLHLRLIFFLLTFSFAWKAQDCGKITIANASKNDPAFIVSLNGVRLSNDYVQTVSFKFVDESSYRVKILQAGSSTPLSYTISSEARYFSAYVLIRDDYGRYSLLLQSKSLMLNNAEPEAAVATAAAIVATPTIAAPVPTPTKAPEPIYQAPVAMNNDVYNRKFNEVKSRTFDDEKMERIRDAFENENFSTNQVIGLMKLFAFDDKRMEAAKFAYPRTIDKDEFYKIYDHFTFNGNKTAMKDWVNKNKGK